LFDTFKNIFIFTTGYRTALQRPQSHKSNHNLPTDRAREWFKPKEAGNLLSSI